NDALGDRLLAALHDDVQEFGEFDIAVLGIRQDFTLGDFATTWHCFTSSICFRWLFPSGGLESHRTLAYSTHPDNSVLRATTLGSPASVMGEHRHNFRPIRPSSGAWRRTWSGTACGLSRPAGPASRARCGSAHPASP